MQEEDEAPPPPPDEPTPEELQARAEREAIQAMEQRVQVGCLISCACCSAGSSPSSDEALTRLLHGIQSLGVG